MSDQVAPVRRQLVLVFADVVGEGFADDDGGSEAEGVAFLADARDGDSLGAQLAVDPRGHLRRLGLVGHVDQGMSHVHTGATGDLLGRTHRARLGRTHQPSLNCTNPRSAWTAFAGVRRSRLTEKDA